MKASIFALATALLVASAAANDNTYVVNNSGKAIVATITYSHFNSLASSKFTNRIIPPFSLDHDTYTHPQDVGDSPPVVNIQIFISGAPKSVTVQANPDYSILVVDAPSGGLDIYQAQHGHLYVQDGSRGLLAHL